MKGTWKDGLAYLFNNGQFKLRYRGRVCNIINYNPTLGAFNVHNDFWDKIKIAYVSDETTILLARTVRDITVSEWELMHQLGLADLDDEGYSLINKGDTIIHLLSIGVYPFDQLHFGTGVVVDITTAVEG